MDENFITILAASIGCLGSIVSAEIGAFATLRYKSSRSEVTPVEYKSAPQFVSSDPIPAQKSSINPWKWIVIIAAILMLSSCACTVSSLVSDLAYQPICYFDPYWGTVCQ